MLDANNYGGVTSENDINYISDVPNSVSEFNMYVRQRGLSFVVESNKDQVDDYNMFVANRLLQNFISGEGPENYVFPTDGVISRSFVNSRIVKDALEKFKNDGPGTYRSSFGFGDAIGNWWDYGTPFNMAGLVGSGTITIIKDEKGIKVTIFNVTSLTSGAFAAKVLSKVPFTSDTAGWPISYVREDDTITPFGNISQTFSFTMENPNNE